MPDGETHQPTFGKDKSKTICGLRAIGAVDRQKRGKGWESPCNYSYQNIWQSMGKHYIIYYIGGIRAKEEDYFIGVLYLISSLHEDFCSWSPIYSLN